MTETSKPADDLHPKQRRTLIQLAFLGRVEKVGDLKPDLDPKLRAGLVSRRFLEQKKSGRGLALELTDAGWQWLIDYPSDRDFDLPKKEQVATLLEVVLRQLRGFLRENQLDLSDVIRRRNVRSGRGAEQDFEISTPRDTRDAVLLAAEELGGASAAQIRLRDLRPKLASYSRQEVDAALHTLHLQGDREQVEVVVWTPGRAGGRPLAFSPLPDFSAVLDDADDFEAAVLMAAGSLAESTGASRGANSPIKTGILTEAIRHFARDGGQMLPALVAFLRELPPEVEVGIAKASKLARDMADTLQATLLGNKALIPEGRGTSLSEVLGIGAKKTRVSVVSLAGLSETNGDRLSFVNQLAVELFTWIRKNPSKGPGLVKGLLVVDEARDFIPSVKSTPCKDSLMRVAAQARKYGFGLLMATQNPTDIDHKAAGQCATQFFGRAASPNVVDAMRQAIEERGGNAPDLTQLGKGQFYFSSSESEKFKRPSESRYPFASPITRMA